MKDDIVIVSAARTPVGAFNGAFANLPAHELGQVAIIEALCEAALPSLRELNLSLAGLTDAGLDRLARSPLARQLVRMNLHSNRLTPAGARSPRRRGLSGMTVGAVVGGAGHGKPHVNVSDIYIMGRRPHGVKGKSESGSRAAR